MTWMGVTYQPPVGLAGGEDVGGVSKQRDGTPAIGGVDRGDDRRWFPGHAQVVEAGRSAVGHHADPSDLPATGGGFDRPHAVERAPEVARNRTRQLHAPEGQPHHVRRAQLVFERAGAQRGPLVRRPLPDGPALLALRAPAQHQLVVVVVAVAATDDADLSLSIVVDDHLRVDAEVAPVGIAGVAERVFAPDRRVLGGGPFLRDVPLAGHRLPRRQAVLEIVEEEHALASGHAGGPRRRRRRVRGRRPFRQITAVASAAGSGAKQQANQTKR